MTPLIAPTSDAALPEYLDALGIPGIIDLHVHFMPDNVQRKVWAFFDRLPEVGEPAWPIAYRYDEVQRVTILRELGVKAFSTLNYAHRPGMAAFLNEYSRRFAAEYDDAIHSATFFPEPGVEELVGQVLDDGAQVFKVHVQVGEFSVLDPLLTSSWELLAKAGTPVAELVERHPDLVLVIAHMGMPEYREFATLAQQAPNVYLDTTLIGTDYAQLAFAPLPEGYVAMLADLGDKVVLGTDFPTIAYRYSHQIEALHRWGLGEDWMRNVLWHTPAKLLRRD